MANLNTTYNVYECTNNQLKSELSEYESMVSLTLKGHTKGHIKVKFA